MKRTLATVSAKNLTLRRKILRNDVCQLKIHVNRTDAVVRLRAGVSAATVAVDVDASSANVDSNYSSRESRCACVRKMSWTLYGRCFFSLCGSLIHNTGAWNLADLFIM